MLSAYLLVSHGSRDPRPETAMQQLAEMVKHKLPSHNQEKLVGIACLEVSPQPLHEQIKQFAHNALAAGYNRLKIIPLFLLPGVHVMKDIPTEVALAQDILGQDIIIDLQPYLGSHPSLANLLAKPMAAQKSAWILLAHGSRHPGSQEPVAALAANLGALTAYWAVPSSLESRVLELVALGKQEIAILPYFLFTGGITDAIALSVEKLKLQFPTVSFHLAEPLGASAELAAIIWDLMDT
jgi:sirohydrochlorin cobaltochelatase